MIKVAISATAVLLGIGYAWAIDESQGTPPTTNPSSSGRPSAILSQNECQSIWNEVNQSATEVSGSAAGQSSSGSPAETSKSVALQDSRAAGDSKDQSSSGSPAETSKSVALQDSRAAGDSNDTSTAASGTSNMGQTGESKSPNLPGSDSGQGLSKQQAQPYIANFAMVDKNNDGQISQAEFQDGCTNGGVQAASRTQGGSPPAPSTSNPSKPGSY
ncbi:MAG: EF-hand domain-containing protein [Methyloceanibacter sp.]|uniref:EF-hand domain-containing protein n=1 Tax=Methyloceanibacter sp. TaxID=1965321 RepID=UPI003D9B3FC9